VEVKHEGGVQTPERGDFQTNRKTPGVTNEKAWKGKAEDGAQTQTRMTEEESTEMAVVG